MSKDQLPPMELLHLLADGKVHSGQELASLLSVSRTAIWKQLAKLETLGLELVSQPGKGYCLIGGLDFLSDSDILRGLSSDVASSIDHLDVITITDSTNAHLMRQSSVSGLLVCVAECQTAGRGRRGRQWVSPFASNIYLSLRFTTDTGVGAIEGLSLAVGVGVARALKNWGVDDVQLKWPNDVLWCGRKLGGILIEILGDPSGICQIIVGLGLNIKTEKSMAAAIDQPWVALDEIMFCRVNRSQIVADLLNDMVPIINGYGHGNNVFARYKSEWESLSAYQDQQVTISAGTSIVNGCLRGVNLSGALLLEVDTEIEVFHGGEVSLRVAL